MADKPDDKLIKFPSNTAYDDLVKGKRKEGGYTVSCVMIVKDEAESLAQAVESVLPFVDEVVIGVDDACTDQTPEIARQYASTYFEFKWENDFAKARNLALEKATCDIIFILDGHEFVPPDNHPTPLYLAKMRKVDLTTVNVLTPLSFFKKLKETGIPINPNNKKPFDVICITLGMNVDPYGNPTLFFLQPRIFGIIGGSNTRPLFIII